MRNNQFLSTTHSLVLRSDRLKINGHKSGVFWLTGLSGSGKSHLAYALELELHKIGINAYVLDGDNIRTGLNSDLDFTDQDRTENIRRIAEVAAIMKDAGMIVITSFISPFKEDRDNARKICGMDEFNEVFIKCPLKICEERDVKGLYKKARNGEIPNFTGISSTYEIPENLNLTIETDKDSIVDCTKTLMDFVVQRVALDK